MFFLLRLIFLSQVFFICSLVFAEKNTVQNSEYLSFTSDQAKTATEILSKLTTRHFRKQTIGDELSKNLLFQYLDLLDPTKSYFLQVDIDEFEKWKFELDDMLKAEDLSAGFSIYNRYKLRATERLQYNIDLLDKGFVFDLTKNEFVSIDIKNNRWQQSIDASNEHWRKKIKGAYLRLKLNDKEPEAARALLIKRYKNLKSRLSKSDKEDVFQSYMAALTGTFDPHTTYLSPKSMENFRISLSLSLTGIGAVLELDGEHTSIVNVIKGGPADKQGILNAGDKIIAVAQDQEDFVDIIGWQLDDVVELIRGKKDSLVKLEIIPAKLEAGGNTRKIEITRDKIKLEEQAAKSKVIEISGNGDVNRIGVIEIPTFYLDVEALYNNEPDFKSTTKDVVRLINELHTNEHVDGLILDLRNNGGGFLQEAKMLTDLFIGKGPIVQVKNTNNYISKAHQSRSNVYYNGPLLVLINRLSASASEIFAGAIQDYGRGIIVGSRSYGKGTVQVQLPLKEGQIKLTESKFYRVSGESTQLLGVTPDIQLPSPYDEEIVGESALNNALPWDTIAPAKHSIYWSRLLKAWPIDILKTAHKKRFLIDPDLIYLNEELNLAKEQRSVKEISLNEEIRRMQSKKYDDDLLVLENKRRSSKGQSKYSSIKEWQAAKDIANDDERKDGDPVSPESDPVLYEAGNIFSDYLNYLVVSLKKNTTN